MSPVFDFFIESKVVPNFARMFDMLLLLCFDFTVSRDLFLRFGLLLLDILEWTLLFESTR